MVRKRRRHTAACKFRVALEAPGGSKTICQLSSEHEIHANQIRARKRQLLADGTEPTHQTALCALISPDHIRPDVPYFPTSWSSDWGQP